MTRTIFGVLALVALSASAAVTVDPATGLWFPPYASPAAYLRRDPSHSYIKDVQRAFNDDPELAKAVCAAIIVAPAPPTNMSAKQMRTMLDMTCVSLHAGQQFREKEEKFASQASARLAQILKEEEARAAEVPDEERDAEYDRVLEEVRDGGDVLRPAFRALSLTPAMTFTAGELLQIRYELRDGADLFRPNDIATFLEQLYRSRAASDRADVIEWKRGLPAVLLFLGKIAEARQAAAAWLAEAPPANASYASVMKAVSDRAGGDLTALRSVAENCRSTALYREQNPGSAPAQYCIDAASWLVVYALETGGDRTARSLADAAFELADVQKQNWPIRLKLVRSATNVDPDGTERHFYDILDEKNIPPGAEIDAVYDLAKLAAHFDPANAAPLYDCWLTLHGVKIPPLPADAWSKLAAMPERQPEESGDCFVPGQNAVESGCVMHALQVREQTAIEAGLWDLAQQSVEKLLALTLAGNGPPGIVRDALFSLASQEAAAGRKKEAGPIVFYLQQQPQDGYIAGQIGRLSDLARDEHDPWPAPTLIDASRLSERCPPPRPIARYSAVR